MRNEKEGTEPIRSQPLAGQGLGPLALIGMVAVSKRNHRRTKHPHARMLSLGLQTAIITAVRAGIDLIPLPFNHGGARYAFVGLFRAMLELDTENTYVLFTPRQTSEWCRTQFPDTRVKVIEVHDEDDVFDHVDKFDLYFGSLNHLKPRLYDRPTVSILHDIQERFLPENFTKGDLLTRYEDYPQMAEAVTTLVTDSYYCKRAIMDKLFIHDSKIEVVYNAPQADLVTNDARDTGHWTRSSFMQSFLLYPSAFYKHKDQEILLDVAARTGRAVVFVGHDLPDGYPLRKEIEKRGLGDKCTIAEDLEPQELRYLYKRSQAVVIPSRYEGFAMPVVEALALGCPLICSDLPVLREVAGRHALFFPPGNIDALCRCIDTLADHHNRQKLLDGVEDQVAKFSWTESARQMLRIFNEAKGKFEAIALAPSKAKIGAVISDASVSSDYASLSQRAANMEWDIMGETRAGSIVLPGALAAVAKAAADAPSAAVLLGDVWETGDGKTRAAHLRRTGDRMWKLEGYLYPEMMFINRRALENWPLGLQIVATASPNWRWDLLRAARREGKLALVHRTLAKVSKDSISEETRKEARRIGMFGYYRGSDDAPVAVSRWRQAEPLVRRLSRFLPVPLQNAGARAWYKLTRSSDK